jgi:signal peptidase I
MNPGAASPEQEPAAASAESGAAAVSVPADGAPTNESQGPGAGRPARRRGPSWFVLLGIALVVMLLVRGFLVQSFYVPSGSMEPTIEPGDRILVNKLATGDALVRGDVVVFNGTTTFAAADRTPKESAGLLGRVLGDAASFLGIELGEQDFVKRIIGLPGDHVVCCDQQGQIMVNGTSIVEPYLMPGDKPSELTFDIVVPPGHLWVMGDHRSDSADSRSHLGDPGGGTVMVSDVVGRASLRYWPLTRLGGFAGQSALADIPKAAAK